MTIKPSNPMSHTDLHQETRPTRRPELIWRQVDEGMVIVSPTAGQVRVLNPLGTIIWERLDGQHTLGQIEQYLAARHPQIAPTQIQTDLHHFIADLQARGLLT
jgi:hypothetical protein